VADSKGADLQREATSLNRAKKEKAADAPQSKLALIYKNYNSKMELVRQGDFLRLREQWVGAAKTPRHVPVLETEGHD
jgi:hypothetical protein